MRGVAIAGTGAFLPGAPIGNEELCARFDLPVTPGWIEEWTGITSRHRCGPDDTAASMATEAARRALDAAGTAPGEIRRVLFASSLGGDRPLPGTGFLVAAALGLRGADVADIHGSCVSWLTALDLACRGVATGVGPTLVVASEAGAAVLDPEDRRAFPLFGEGAAAVVVVPSRGGRGGIAAGRFVADGEHWRYLWKPGPGDPEAADGGAVRFGTGGRHIRRILPEILGSVVGPALAGAGWAPADVDRFVPHQPNAAWMPELVRQLGIPEGRTDVFVGTTGTIPTAMIPLGLDRAWRSDAPPRSGERILMVSIGAGVAAGAVAWEVA